MEKYTVLYLVAFAAFLTACQQMDTPQDVLQKNEILLTAPALAVTVTEEECTAIEVTQGTQVMWTNGDAVILTIKLEQLDDAGAVLNTENYELQPGGILTKVFNEPATYRYTCSEDMDWYSTITVK